MRLATVTALAATAAFTLAFAAPADAQQPRGYYRGQPTERITIIDETGRVRTKITVRPRSYLDGGTVVVPGERKFMDYAQPLTHMNGAPTAAWDPLGIHRWPLPMPFELPGFQPYSYW
jgi:hypothetical protein